MTPERWERVGRLYAAALEVPAEERAGFLDRSCGSDLALRREVESLLAAEGEAGSFLAAGAMQDAAQLLFAEKGPQLVGQRLNQYEVLSLIGRGGMGEVYLARDTRLGRQIALKLLPSYFTKDEARLRRFQQEARAASALSHPNILTIHEIGEADGTHFISMEYVDGVTLREKIHREKTGLRKLLRYLQQVAEGLAKAHAAGIVHRDLKPDNIMVTRDGYAKVLDFGLAKLMEPQKGFGSDGVAPPNEVATTILRQPSTPGMVMGTAGYMSPEQAQGRTKEIDHRSDIFSFGCILYEAATGHQPFAADSVIRSLHKVVYEPAPPIREFNPSAPPELQRVVRRCLAKDPEERYQSIKDVALELKELRHEMGSGAETDATAPPMQGSGEMAGRGVGRLSATAGAEAASTGEVSAPRQTSSAGYIVTEIKRHRRGAAIITAALLAVAAGLAFAWYRFIGRPRTAPTATTPQLIPLTTFPGSEDSLSFSPDGNQVAFSWDGEKADNTDIYVKLIGAGAPLRLTTNPAADSDPAWSPDGRHIAFLRRSSGSSGFYLVPALGGPERKLAEASADRSQIYGHSLSYSPDGKFLAVADKDSPQGPFGIFLLSLETGEKRRLTTPPAQYRGDWNPAFSPDGSTLAFTRTSSGAVNDVYLVPVAGGDPTRLTFDDTFAERPAWTADGRELVFSSERGGGIPYLWRVAVTGGTPARVAGVGLNASSPAISRRGDRLAYTQVLADNNIWRFEVERSTATGKSPKRLISSTLPDSSPNYSPDGERIAFASLRSGSWEIWVCEADGSNPVQLTHFSRGMTGTPRWSPDGREVAFDATAEGSFNIYVVNAEGGRPRRLTTGPSENVAPSYSRDGRFVYFGSYRSGSLQIWKVPAEGGEAAQVTKGGGFEGFESPDGKVFYYAKGLGVPGIWRVAVGGGEETPVLDSDKAGYWRYWAVVSEGIYYATAEEPSRPVVKFFSFAQRQSAEIATPEKAPAAAAAAGLSVSPDGRWILYAQMDQSGSDIMLMEKFR